MAVFTFEIVHSDDAPIVAHLLNLSDARAVWSLVEVMALPMQKRNGTFIQVKNSKGEIVVRAGISTILSSIQKCPCADCPIKSERRRLIFEYHAAFDFGIQMQCPLREMDMEVFPEGYEAAYARIRMRATNLHRQRRT